MPSRKEDIEFLKAYLLRLQKRRYSLIVDKWQPLSTAPGTDIPAIDPEAERAAGLADSNGLDGDVFREYLLELVPDDPLPPPMKKKLEAQIKTIPRVIAKLEESEHDKEGMEDTGNVNPPHLEIDEERQQVICGGNRHDVTEDQIRILKRLSEKPGAWVMGKHLRLMGPDSDQRVDKIIKRLPQQIREKIESHKRNGYRLKETPR